MRPNRKQHQLWEGIDKLFLIAIVFLLFAGIMMLASASMPIADRDLGDPYGYVFKQSFAIVLGLLFGLIIFSIPSQFLEKFGIALPIIALLLLSMVYIPEIGIKVNGATRWINLGVGPNIQVVDPARLLFLIYISGYCYRQQKELREGFVSLLKPMIFILPACTLLLLQPDFGSTVVLLTVTAALFFLAGFKLRYFFLLIIILALLFSALVYFSPYKLARVVSFMDPWSMADKGGYQLVNSLIAIGSGGFFGIGLGEGVQKLFYLPEAHTDFIFAIIAEELGLMGTILFLSFYTLLISRVFIIAFRAISIERLFQGYLCFSIGIWISIQVIINLGVNMGLLPTKGLILPLISYGSSSMIMTLITLAIVLRIGCEIPREKINKKING
ncbi:MAG: putative lipid II flippase FtsW [Gammaproteobacteria bacterium]|nr:putative lipid II flippase FtsW [Gammaproteobacteria bacterium]